MGKTPKFNKAISLILDKMEPGERKCSECNSIFEITNLDIDFFKIFRVPEPKMCPVCRKRVRLAFSNYTHFFKRSCDVPGHSEKIISSIPKDVKFPVYDFDAYWYGNRNWRDYGKDYDLNNPFASQFKDLFNISPEPALNRDPASVNSDYTSYGSNFKNCYYLFGGMGSEEVMFGLWAMGSRNSLDTLITLNTDLIYEGVYPENCYDCNFIYFSRDCLNSSFMYDCRSCTDCFGCVNLRSKKYCIWNKQYSKEEYFKKRKGINLGNRDELDSYKVKFIDFIKSFPVRATRNEHSENSNGNYLINTKNCFLSMWCLDSENLSHTDFTLDNRDSYDATVSNNSEKIYSTSVTGRECFNVKFSVNGRVLTDCEYIINCKDSKDLFGCIGVENGRFCIFNKQYTEEGYWKKLDEIKTKMLEDGEYGEFFPLSLSPFPYNCSFANVVDPLTEKEVFAIDGWWYDEENNLPDDIELIKSENLPKDIKDVGDDILNKAIISEGGKPFKVVKQELDFYRRKQIALPSLSPYERIIDRFKFVNNFRVIKEKCVKCNMEIWSSFDSKKGFKPYCDDCYKKEIY